MIHFLWVAVAAQGFVETPSRPCETAPRSLWHPCMASHPTRYCTTFCCIRIRLSSHSSMCIWCWQLSTICKDKQFFHAVKVLFSFSAGCTEYNFRWLSPTDGIPHLLKAISRAESQQPTQANILTMFRCKHTSIGQCNTRLKLSATKKFLHTRLLKALSWSTGYTFTAACTLPCRAVTTA